MIYLSHAIAAMLLVNAIPHFVQGISGQAFQTPFAKPPGVGESSAMVNVLWGAFNFIAGAVLLNYFAAFEWGMNPDTLISGAAALVFAVGLSWHFQRVRHPRSAN